MKRTTALLSILTLSLTIHPTAYAAGMDMSNMAMESTYGT